MTEDPAAVPEPGGEVMGGAEPDEQRTDVMGGAEPGEQRTDVMGGTQPGRRRASSPEPGNQPG